jgi:formylmethanofuran dehydrogenase subunit C
MPLTLRWNAATPLPVDGEGLRPDALAGLPAVEVARRPILVGNTLAEVGELFRIEGEMDDGRLVIEGDLSSLRGLGRGMAAGRLTIRGDAGPHLGAGMAGGTIEVLGTAGDWAGAEMRGGMLHVRGGAGHGLGAAEPGSRLGMRDGVILVEGSIGDEAGLAMRRGLIAVLAAAGAGLGRAMVAGSIFAFGRVGPYPGAGMKRGTLALFGLQRPDAPLVLPAFLPSGRYRPPFVTVYLRQLRAWGFPVPEASFGGTFERYNGDVVARGQGEILVRRPS